jgi:hypothetical protein
MTRWMVVAVPPLPLGVLIGDAVPSPLLALSPPPPQAATANISAGNPVSKKTRIEQSPRFKRRR